MRKALVSLVVLAFASACGWTTQPVPPRDPGTVVVEQPSPAPTLSPSPVRYVVITDRHHNVICVDTDMELNFFEC